MRLSLVALPVSIIIAIIIGFIGGALMGENLNPSLIRSTVTAFVGAWIGSFLFMDSGPLIGGFPILPGLTGSAILVLLTGMPIRCKTFSGSR